MFLLQGGGVTVDVNQLSESTITQLIIAILLVIGAGLFILVKYGAKIGPVDTRRTKSTESSIEHQSKELKKAEENLRLKIRQATSALNNRLSNIFYEFRMCPSTIEALGRSIPTVLFEAANNNNFNTALLPENKDIYLSNMLKSIQDEYQTRYNSFRGIACEMFGEMPIWDEIKEKIQNYLLEWSDRIITEEIKYCDTQIEIYQKYEPHFKSDSYQSGKTVSCIAECKETKNKLDRHGKGWK